MWDLVVLPSLKKKHTMKKRDKYYEIKSKYNKFCKTKLTYEVTNLI